MKLQLKKLDLTDVHKLVSWARNEGWNPGPYDADIFWATDPEGFYGFHLDGDLIAGGALISYEGNYGFMGLFIVREDLRNCGIGNKLWYLRRDRLLARLKPGASIGMDGVLAMQSYYNKGGFDIAFRDERYEFIADSQELKPEVSPVEENDFDSVLNYDRICFGYNRPEFLKPWLQLPDTHGFKWEGPDGLKGYAVLRKAEKGYKTGPLFAEDPHVAEALFQACLNAVKGSLVYLDIPMVNTAAVELVKKYNGKYVFECARMYYGPPPPIDVKRVFGITTFELG